MYAGLHIKQVQNDTLSHILLSRISTLYNDVMVIHETNVARSIYASNEEETPSQIFLAFVEGTYHNIPDFWDLWMRLRHSLTREMLLTERDLIALANNEDCGPFEEIPGKCL